MLPDISRFLPVPPVAVEFATDMGSCFIRKGQLFKNVIGPGNILYNLLTEIHSPMVVVFFQHLYYLNLVSMFVQFHF